MTPCLPASPTVGPDGDVYQGVLERPFASRHFRGWLLHFDAGLNPAGVPGGFGWDDTASIVPASMVTAYQGTSSYLLFVKYNDYAQLGGDGVSRLAVLEPGFPDELEVSARTDDGEIQALRHRTRAIEGVQFHPESVLSEHGRALFTNFLGLARG